MKQTGIITLIVLIALGSLSCASMGNPTAEYSTGELYQDFGQFRKIIEDRTPGLYTNEAELKSKLDRAEAEIAEGMTEIEFYRLLAPIAAELRCGHSFLSVSEAMEENMRTNALYFPLEVRIIEGRLFVIADPHDTGVVPGAEIVTINNELASDVIHTIAANMPTDGRDTGRPRYETERWFAAMYYSYIANPEAFTLEIIEPASSEPSRINVPAVSDSSLAKTSKGVVHHTADTPWSSAVNVDYGYLKIPTFSYSDQDKYNQALKTFFSELSSRGTDKLILDLRGNYGGTPSPTVELFKYLINQPIPFFADDNPFYLAKWKAPVEPAPEAFAGKLYVLTDEAGFSMNSFLMSLLRYHGIGTLVGARTSGSFMCSDASREAVLFNTGLRFRYSTDVFKTAVEGQEAGIGIDPDVHVEWTLEDYIEGSDPVLEAALDGM